MDRITVEPTREWHIEKMAPHVREDDINELFSVALIKPCDALYAAYDSSGSCWTAQSEGKILCIFGVAPINMLGGVGCPWMIGTEEINSHAREFLVKGRKIVEGWKQSYPHLYNYVDTRNKKAIRWLKWMGFTVHNPEPYGIFKMPFHRFDMEAN